MSSIAIDEEFESLITARARRRKKHHQSDSVAIVMASRRPEDLKNVLHDIYSQSLPSFELHLGLHGYKADSILTQQIMKLRHRKISVSIHHFESKETLGNILTTLATQSKTRFVAKMDDDDIYGPEHLHDLLDAIIEYNSDVVGRAMNYIYLEPINLTVRRATGVGVSAYELFSDWVCGGTILIERRAGEAAGWFGSGVTAVDTHLLQGVKANNGKIWRTFGTGYIYRRREGDHTYNTGYGKYLSAASEEWVGMISGPEFGVRK
jgi:hypothetical protein